MTEKKLAGYYFVPAFEETEEPAREPEQTPALPRMLTIQQLVRECRGTGITESAIRTLIWENRIAHVKIGKKYLINYDRFIDFLNTAPQPEEPPRGVIRPIPEKLKREEAQA